MRQRGLLRRALHEKPSALADGLVTVDNPVTLIRPNRLGVSRFAIGKRRAFVGFQIVEVHLECFIARCIAVVN